MRRTARRIAILSAITAAFVILSAERPPPRAPRSPSLFTRPDTGGGGRGRAPDGRRHPVDRGAIVIARAGLQSDGTAEVPQDHSLAGGFDRGGRSYEDNLVVHASRII